MTPKELLHPRTAATGAQPDVLSLAQWPIPLFNTVVIHVQGAHAAQFLHQQLTQDVLAMPDHSARAAAWCSSKGRVLASFVLLRQRADSLFLLCAADIADRVVLGLKKYILRAKVQLDTLSRGQLSVWGQLSPLAAVAPAPYSIRTWSATEYRNPNAPPQFPDATEVLLSSSSVTGLQRSVVLQALGGDEQRHSQRHLQALPAAAMPGVAQHLWRWCALHSGVCRVGLALSDRFIAQMLNYESLDFIHFKKGCYPGQEVVARSQFRGQVKRRLGLLQADVARDTERSLAGAALYALANADGTQRAVSEQDPCGTVLASASWQGQTVVWAVLPISMWEQQRSVTIVGEGAADLGSDQVQFTPLPLPYALNTDI